MTSLNNQQMTTEEFVRNRVHELVEFFRAWYKKHWRIGLARRMGRKYLPRFLLSKKCTITFKQLQTVEDTARQMGFRPGRADFKPAGQNTVHKSSP